MQLATLETNGTRPFAAAQWLKGMICAGAVAILIDRVWIMSRVPLWLDETWSAMIATQGAWHSFWREAWLDCNPPLYYFSLKLWVSVFGDSDIALRVPSLIFTTAAAVFLIKYGSKTLGDFGKWTWGALVLFWMHSLTLSVDARGYGLLMFLSAVNIVVFARLHHQPTLRIAALWVLTCGLMFLTHYFAATIIAAQMGLLLYRHKLNLIRVWPAALIGLPPLAWFVFQRSRLMEYARPDVAWYDPLTFNNALSYVAYVFGPPLPAFLPLVLVILGIGLMLNPGRTEASGAASHLQSEDGSSLWATALSGLLGFAIALVLGAFRASLSDRYFVPVVPAMMLSLTLIALRSKRREIICALLVGVYLISSLNFSALEEFSQNRNDYGYEKGSTFIAENQPTHLFFTWDHPASKILETSSLEKIGSFFLRRDGLNLTITALQLKEHDDPNVVLTNAAYGDRPAIIWLYNTARTSAARHHPPRLDDDPAWSCRRYTHPYMQGELGEIACVKKRAADV